MNAQMTCHNVIRRLKHLKSKYPNRYVNSELVLAIEELEALEKSLTRINGGNNGRKRKAPDGAGAEGDVSRV